MDSPSFISESDNIDNVFDILDREYGASSYGKEKYSGSELNWMGYLYRYWAYVYEMSSRQIFRIINGREMHKLYYAYHSLDPEQAIDRMMEAKHVSNPKFATEEDRIKEGVAILRNLKQEESS